jgi:hypothetical protein
VWYWIEQRPTGGTWTRLTTPLTTCCTAVAGLLSNGTTYEFRVRATNASGDSVASNVVSAKPMPPLPQAATGLTAATGDGKVTLRWTASPTPNVWYWIEQRPVGGNWLRLQTPATTCCTTDVGWLYNGTTYEFRVMATNAAGDSGASNVVSARPMPPFPQPPTGLTAAAGDGKVTLQWAASSTPAVYYWVEQRSAGGNWQRLTIPVVICCSMVAGWLANGATYEFRVRASNLAGDSVTSNVATARPLPPVPAAPSNLFARPGFDAVDLSWSASPTPNVMYNVYVRNVTLNGPWLKQTYPTASTSMRVALLTYGQTYDFLVKAANVWYESSASNVARATTIRAGCSAVGLTPGIYPVTSSYAEARGTNSTACTGPVYNVRVSVKLWMLALTQQWHVESTADTDWGAVPVSRYGYSTAAARFIGYYMTQATTTWTLPDGSPGESVSYSPTVWLEYG